MKSTTNDMTTGSPVKLIIMFMIPMCLGNLFQQFYNIADSIVAGKFIGVNALAAIGSTGSLMFFVTGWLNGLSSGFAIIIAQMFGAKKYDRMRHYVAMSIYLMAAFSIAMTIGFGIANGPILRLMNTPDEVFGDVKAYMGIIYAGLIVTGAYNTLAAFLRALGDSKSPLYFLIISAGINVILDIVFIACLGMGVEGCGYATVIAQGISALCCLFYISKRFPLLHLEKKNFGIAWGSFARLLKLGIPMGLQFSITAIGTIIVQGAINVYGPVYMAGFSAAGKIQKRTGKKAWLLFAAVADKEYETMAKELCEGLNWAGIGVVHMNSDRGLSAGRLSDVFKTYASCQVVSYEDTEEAMEQMQNRAGDDLLFCAGSLYLIGELKVQLKKGEKIQ